MRGEPVTKAEEQIFNQISYQLLLARYYLADNKPTHICKAQAQVVREMFMPFVEELLAELEKD